LLRRGAVASFLVRAFYVFNNVGRFLGAPAVDFFRKNKEETVMQM
jgi:hypothetical protein